MILLLLTQIQLSFGVSTSRIRSQQSHTLQAMFPDISLQTIHNKQNIFALNISESYDTDLIDEDGKIIETPYVSLDNLDLDHFIVENECVAFPKYPQLTELMDYSYVLCIDSIPYMEFKQLYILFGYYYSNRLFKLVQMKWDLVLIQFKLSTKYWVVSQQRKSIDLKQYIDVQDQSIRTKAYFSCPKGHLNFLVISEYGAFWIPKFVDFDDPKTEILPEQDKNFIKRKEIIRIFTYESIVAIAAGEEGVDIYRCGYKISSNFDKKIYYLTTIGNIQMELNSSQQIYIIGVKINENLLYVLDEDLGLFIFDIQNIQKGVLKMRIPIPRTIAFDFYGNTLMVVAETVNHIQYILEIFLDFNANTYYVNRVYVDDFTFVDIQMTDEYAFFIAEDTHMIIKHSIFNGFVKNNKELVRTFFEDQLIKFQQFTSVVEQSQRYSKTIYYVGLSKKSIHAWKFRNYNSFLACSFDSRVEKEYTLKSNASFCYQDQETSPYIQCQMIQKVSVTSDGTLLESDSLTLIITVSCISSAIFILLIVLLCTKWRKFVKSIKQKTEKLRNKQDYNRIDQEKNP